MADEPRTATLPYSADADPAVESLIEGIAIPPRPAMLAAVQQEIAADDPDLRRVSRIVAGDVALTAGVLRSVNSPLYSLSRKAGSIDEAIALLGLRQIGALVAGFALRQAVSGDRAALTRFWDTSGKRSYALARLAAGLRGVAPEAAQTFGLFCDVGIPLLMLRFADYRETLKRANQSEALPFTEVEQAAHQTDHAAIGALMARSWGLPRLVFDAIRSHHDYTVFYDPKVDPAVQRLIAMALVAEYAIQRYGRMNASLEWNKAGDAACGLLMLGEDDLDDWTDTLAEGFAAGVN